MVRFNDFYMAWYWLYSHPINLCPEDSNPDSNFGVGMYELDIHVTKVDPITRRVEQDDSRNTLTEIWLEFGPYENYTEQFPELPPHYQRTHDINLDCGGETFEEAIINLANLVFEHYGDYVHE